MDHATKLRQEDQHHESGFCSFAFGGWEVSLLFKQWEIKMGELEYLEEISIEYIASRYDFAKQNHSIDLIFKGEKFDEFACMRLSFFNRKYRLVTIESV